MPHSIFVSYHYNDEKSKSCCLQLQEWANEQSYLGDNITITKAEDNDTITEKDAIKKHLKPKLKGISMLLVLIGDDGHNRPWLDYEIQHAQSGKKHIIKVRVPGTTGGEPEAIKKLPMIDFSVEEIRKQIDILIGR